MSIHGWEQMTRDQKVAALVRHDGPERQCPACGRMIHVVRGYWVQHTDPRSWEGRQAPQQCTNELRPA
jgi:hypothetical protein